jgi:hypothetical protein
MLREIRVKKSSRVNFTQTHAVFVNALVNIARWLFIFIATRRICKDSFEIVVTEDGKSVSDPTELVYL